MATKTTAAPKQGTPAAPVKSTIKPELLPADLGGGNIAFVKRGDYARTISNAFALKEKVDVKKDHVTQILDGLDKFVDKKQDLPDEAPGDNPEEIQKLFAIVKEDYEAGQDEVIRLAEEKAAAEAKAEAEKKEAEEKENQLFAKIKEQRPDLGDLAAKFDCGDMDRFIAKPGTTTEDLLGALNTGLKMSEFTGWMIGDLIVELETRGQINVVQRLAEENNQAYNTVYANAKTSRAFPPDTRKKGVSQTIYREVGTAKFTDEQRKKALPALVNDIAAGKYTTQTVREAVRKIQGKEDAVEVAPEDNEKYAFLIIDVTLEDESKQIQTTIGMPKELLTGAARIVDPKTMKQFAGFNKKGDNRWVALDVYKKPEPQKTEETPASTPAATTTKKGPKKK